MSPVAMLEVSSTLNRPRVPSGVTTLIRQGAAVIVATSDAALRPHIARAWGAEVLGEFGPVRLCVSAPPGSPTASNLREDQEIAVTIARPSTYRSMQMKGVISEARSPTGDELVLVEDHATAFMADVERVGVNPRLVRRLLERSTLVSVTFGLEELYDQTPGPGAGRAL